MKEYTYLIVARINMADFSPSIKELEDDVNQTMSEFGFKEKMFFESKTPIAKVTLPHPITDKERQEILDICNKDSKIQYELEEQ